MDRRKHQKLQQAYKFPEELIVFLKEKLPEVLVPWIHLPKLERHRNSSEPQEPSCSYKFEHPHQNSALHILNEVSTTFLL